MAHGDQLSLLNISLIRNLINPALKEAIGYIKSDIKCSSDDSDEKVGSLLDQEAEKVMLQLGVNDKKTLLRNVAEDGSVYDMTLLLKYEADVNAKNEAEQTPMFYAFRNSIEMVKLLLDHSEVKDWEIFRQALVYGTEEMLGLLLCKSLLEILNDTAPGAISTNNKVDEFPNTETLINAFLQHQLHLSNIEESYPLLIFFAARMCRKDILHIILNDCRKNWESIKEKQIGKHIGIYYEPRAPKELNVQGRFDGTALHHAVVHQHVEAVRFLLEEGADPHCQDERKFTPLHMASCLQDGEMCQLLLSFGANVNPNFDFTPNPLNLVCGSFKRKYYIYLNYSYMDVTKYRVELDGAFHPQIMKLLLRNGADPDRPNRMNSSPLLIACEYGRLEEVKILLEYGANIRAVDSSGYSALHYAAKGSRSLEIVDFLLEKGLDINLKSNGNDTPLMRATWNRTAMTEYLVDRGANINAMNVKGETTLLHAMRTVSIDGIFECLLELGADWSVNPTVIPYRLSDCVYRNLEVLISFAALTENEMNVPIQYYHGYANEEQVRKVLNYFRKSKLEVVKLKMTTTSEDVKSSCFDFLTKDFYTSVQIARNSGSTFFLHFSGYQNEFPCYNSLLKYRFKMIQNLENVVDQTFNFISNYANLPPEIVEMIMSHLRSKDFRIFGRVLLNKRF